MNKKPKTVWNLIIQKPCAALSVIAFILISAVLNVMEVLVLERFIENFSVFHWRQSLCFAVLFSGICAFYYIQTPFSDYLKQKIRKIRLFLHDCRINRKTVMQMDFFRYCKYLVEHWEQQVFLY